VHEENPGASKGMAQKIQFVVCVSYKPVPVDF
jgi:ABC-type uncharacterized transport system ATPase subunit